MLVVTLPQALADDPAVFFREARAAAADLVEIRGDLTPEVVFDFDEAPPLVLAPRGRPCAFARGRKLAFLDLEQHEERGSHAAERVIRSFHDHQATPTFQVLRDRAAALRSAGADVVKIATRVRRPLDLLTLHNLQDELAQDGPAAVIGMGPMAAPNRWLSPWRNALTYAFVNGWAPSAEGQIAAADYAHVAGEGPPRLFAVLGGSAMRSLSPSIHNPLFEEHGIRARFLAVACDDLDETWTVLTRMGFRGFAVTAPHKRGAAVKMNRLDPLARALETCNTCVLERGLWAGYQKDVDGLRHGYPFLAGVRGVAVVGSGGVVPAVLEALAQLGARDVVVHARDLDRRRELARRFGVAEAGLEDLAHRRVQALVWALPVDRPDVELPRAAGKDAHAIDLRYLDAERLLARARARGFLAHDGLSMLVHQARAQFELFTGEAVGDARLALIERSLRDGIG